MKRIIKISTIVLAILFSTNAKAATYPIINLEGSKVLQIDLNDWTDSSITITLRDVYGTILHSDISTNQQLTNRKYNLENLPVGSYQLIVEGENKKSIHTLAVGFTKITTNKIEDVVVYKPTFNVRGDYLELSHLALGKNVELAILDQNGVFFSKSFKGESTINTRFDISDLPAGNYIVSLTSENLYVTKEFTK